jgi:hypothetical protein
MEQPYIAPNQKPESPQLERKEPPSYGVSTKQEIVQINRRQATESTAVPYTIYFADETTLTLTADIIYADYDPSSGGAEHTNWSINFAVSAGVMTKVVTYSDETDRYPDDGAGPPAAQTFYRLPLIREVAGEPLTISTGGVYQEDTTCIDGEGRQQLIKIG